MELKIQLLHRDLASGRIIQEEEEFTEVTILLRWHQLVHVEAQEACLHLAPFEEVLTGQEAFSYDLPVEVIIAKVRMVPCFTG